MATLQKELAQVVKRRGSLTDAAVIEVSRRLDEAVLEYLKMANATSVQERAG